MELNRNLWHVRYYFWCLDILSEAYEYDTYRLQERTNLCHYMRVVLVYTPFTLLLQALFYTLIIGVVTALPVHLFGWIGYLQLLIYVAMAVGGVLGFKKLRALRRRRETEWSRRHDEEYHASSQPVTATAPSQSGFLTLIFEWVVAQKKKICPTITFTETQERS